MSQITTKRCIPVGLLRRSCRNHKSSIVESDLASAEDQTSNPPIKRIKVEPKIKVKEEKLENDFNDSVSQHDDDQESLSLDGFIEADRDELDLERTLLGGQSFRWTKQEHKSGLVFTGIVQNHVFQLWRHTSDKIAFRSLNKESQMLKISERRTFLEDYFQLKYKLKDLYSEWSANDQHLAKCCQQYQGFRILRQDPVENLFSFICATNNNIKRISQMVENLCKTFGNSLELNCDSLDKQSIFRNYNSFPSVESLASLEVFQCLRYELGFGYRAKFITQTANELLKLTESSGHKTARDLLLSLRDLQYKDTCKQLMKFPGIGRKVADCICLMSMDHLNSVPIDCHIHEIVCRYYMPNLKNERKTLTDSVHDLIGDYFNKLHGSLAGWSTSILFISELKHLKIDKKSEKKQPKKSK